MLQLRVVRDYEGPFARGLIEEKLLGGGSGRVGSMVQVGNMVLLEGIQIVDDKIRNILLREYVVRAASNPGAMKSVLRKSVYSFVVWLVAYLECVDGCGSSDRLIMLEVLPSTGTDNQISNGGGEETNYTTTLAPSLPIDGVSVE